MRDTDLVAIIKAHRKDSLGSLGGELSNERAQALDHYHGRPYGNEVDGRSQVVSRDLAEAVDWVLPGMLQVFTASGNIAEFEAVGPEDEELAQQESDVINKVFMQDNDGFMVLHDSVKDALLLKNGYIKVLWEEDEKTTVKEYSGLTMDEVTLLLDDLQKEGSTVKIEGQESKQVAIETPNGVIPLEVFDLKLRITTKKGRVVTLPIPPEEIRVSRGCTGVLSESPFVEHVTKKYRSDLIEMGMDRKFVDSLPASDDEDNDNEELARDSVADESDDTEGAYNDRSMDEVEYCEAYVRVDWDGDGIAELRKVVTVSDRIPPGDDWNEEIDELPIVGGVIKRMPHRHVGESLDDVLADIQEIKTALQRQVLDNTYSVNNAQYAINERVNVNDMLQSLPGGLKRVKGLDPVTGSIEPLMTPPILQSIMPAIDYFDVVKGNRTGVTEASTGIDPDVLKQTTKGAYLENLSRASQKVMMYTRLIAETLVKPALMLVHSRLIKHQDKPFVTKLRGKFVQVNPQEWKVRSDIVLKVGIGTGSSEEKQRNIQLMAQAQAALAQFALVGPKQAFNLFADLARALGYSMPEKYAMDPDSPEFQQMMANKQQGQSNPLAEVEQIKQQAETMRRDAEMKYQAMKDQQEAQMKMTNDALDRRSKEIIEAAKLEVSMMLKAMTPPDMGPAGMGAGLAQ